MNEKLNPIMKPLIEDFIRLQETLKPINFIEQVKDVLTTFHKYDPKKKYDTVVNWNLVGSLGDPETWEGTDVSIAMKKGANDGLAGTLVDMNVMQEILY